jgi:hypothetical protein
MQKPAVGTTVYRLKPDKHFPKGLRVRKSIDQPYPSVTLVVAVRDGRILFVDKDETMTPEPG